MFPRNWRAAQRLLLASHRPPADEPPLFDELNANVPGGSDCPRRLLPHSSGEPFEDDWLALAVTLANWPRNGCVGQADHSHQATNLALDYDTDGHHRGEVGAGLQSGKLFVLFSRSHGGGPAISIHHAANRSL